jgi:hypothetical protein
MAHEHERNDFAIKDDEWLYVHDNILDKNNWSVATWSEIK